MQPNGPGGLENLGWLVLIVLFVTGTLTVVESVFGLDGWAFWLVSLPLIGLFVTGLLLAYYRIYLDEAPRDVLAPGSDAPGSADDPGFPLNFTFGVVVAFVVYIAVATTYSVVLVNAPALAGVAFAAVAGVVVLGVCALSLVAYDRLFLR